MRGFMKLIGIAAGVIALLVIVVAVVLATIDTESFREPLLRYVKDVTGRDLVIRSPLKLELALEPRLVANDVTLSNAPWAHQPDMLAIKRVEAQFALMPLLRRQFEVSHFNLVGPTIALETDAKGSGNWEFAHAQADASARAPQSGSGRGVSLAALALADVSITDGALTYLDGKTGKTTRLDIERLTLHADSPQLPLTAAFRGTVDGIPVALEGALGPVEALKTGSWPYPIALHGQVNDQKTSVSTKLSVAEGAVSLTDLSAEFGRTSVRGSLRVAKNGARPRYEIKLEAPAVYVADIVPSLATVNPADAKAPAAKSRYLFSPEPFDFSALRTVDAKGEVAIGKLVLDQDRDLEDVKLEFDLERGILRTTRLQASALGGTLSGRTSIDASGTNARLDISLRGRALALAAVLRALKLPRETRGGGVDITLDLALRGNSPRQWASDADGVALAVVGQATLLPANSNLDAALNKLGAAVNPFRAVRDSTELECAVIRLPLRSGIAQIDRSIAMETRELSVSASGKIDLRDETLSLSFAPRVKQGIPIDIPQIAQLIRFEGPLTAPRVSIDAVATAATAARVGVGIATSGLSILAESLLKGAKGNVDVCKLALDSHAARSSVGEAAAPDPKARAASPLDAIGKAIGDVFKR